MSSYLSLQFKYMIFYTGIVDIVWIYENGVKDSRPNQAFFLKVKRKVSLFFPPLVYLPFIAYIAYFSLFYMAWRLP